MENILTCASPTRGMAGAARHLLQMEKGSISAFRNTSHPRQTTNKNTQLHYNTCLKAIYM